MPVASDSNQREIRLAVRVIRYWFLTLCHDLCLREFPDVEIRKRAHIDSINAPAAGEAIADAWRVRIYLQVKGTAVEYIRTLAHELRHLWQVQNDIPQTERDCEEYEDYVLQRYARGPNAGPYDGLIIGLSRVYRCPRCGDRSDENKICILCLGLEEEETRNRESKERERVASKRAAETQRAASERIGDAEARLKQKEINWWLRKIDNHPDNGKYGYWLIDGQFYVRARSAGEALVKLSKSVTLENCRRPKVKFVGSNVAGGSTPLC